MKLSETKHRATLVLAVKGRIDTETAKEFGDELLARIKTQGIDKVVLDFSGVDFISSACLRELMINFKHAREAKVALLVAAMQPMVLEIFQLSRFDTIMPCLATIEQALKTQVALQSTPAKGARDTNSVVVHFWGTRGSLPAPLTLQQLRNKLASALVAGAGMNLDTIERANSFVESLPFHIGGTYGGNSSCVELSAHDNNVVLLDLGSGARLAGQDALRRLAGRSGEFHIFMSHLHWDHIMGFPFFTPAYIPGQRIRIYGCHDQLENAFRRQQAEPSFPVDLSKMASHIEFVHLELGRSYHIAGYQVSTKLQQHHGDSYGYRFEKNGKCVVYSTDAEYKPENMINIQECVELFQDADLVIFDAMYSLADSVSVKEDWGHSSNIMGVELCQQAHAKRLALVHHEPANDDAAIGRSYHDALRLEELTRQGERLEIYSAYDGLEIQL
ncbi:MAG: STAS domain-containing protein [Phycisphaerales bacterium]|nr:STAS domain-containing protein [Phycisphaerales bacterium]